ncbi:MAG: phosphotransferase [Verrucomicrobiales bacterium]
MDLHQIESRTREVFPAWKDTPLECSLIEKGGSGRVYVRVGINGSKESIIAMHYTRDRSDNLRFAAITDFLVRHGVPCPAILRRQEDDNLLWIQDLGSVDLGSLTGADWETERRPAYESALRAVVRLHGFVESDPPDDLPAMELSFDEALYEWEQEYFLKQYVSRFLAPEKADLLRGDPSLKALRRELSGLPRSLVHRDFQSTNVMIFGGRTYLIDYQGLRWGRPEYDLASLIYDPYTEFTADERRHLVDFYCGLLEDGGRAVDCDEFRVRLNQCAAQRLMQALGAYGFLSEEKGLKEFLRHIPAARSRLAELSNGDGGLPVLADLLAAPG